jgi:LPXTG-site transpeptidase (sortase) family protein
MRMWLGNGRHRQAFYSLFLIILLAIGAWILFGTNVFSGGGDQLTKVGSASAAERGTPRETFDPTATRLAQKRRLAADKKAAAEEEKAATEKQTGEKQTRQKSAAKRATSEASASAEPNPAPVAAPAATPSSTNMYLSIPKLGLNNVLVQDGTTETILSEGVGHLPGTGYPWIPGSNTYIAGHRLGYPGTPSDHVFWGLPSLVPGDVVYLTDSNGHTYTYRVSKIMEVPPTDLAVADPVGTDVLTLQTCIENYGDEWTAGPDWLVRFIVRAYRVS